MTGGPTTPHDEGDWGPHPWHLYVGVPEILLTEKFPAAVRHLAMRAQFVVLMLNDPRIVEAVDRASRRHRVTFPKAAEALRLRIMYADSDDAAASEVSTTPESIEFFEQHNRWTRSIFRALRRALLAFETPTLPGGFAWPWLLHDLGTAYGQWCLDRALGTEERPAIVYNIDRVPPRAAPLPGEGHRAALARARKAMPRATGRAPVKKLEMQLQYALWFYRHHALGESISSLAREYHANEHRQPDDDRHDRPTIRRGVRQVKRALRDFPSHTPGGEAKRRRS